MFSTIKIAIKSKIPILFFMAWNNKLEGVLSKAISKLTSDIYNKKILAHSIRKMGLSSAIPNLIYSGDMQSGLNQIVLSHLCMDKKN